MASVAEQRIETVQLVTFSINEAVYGSEIIRVQEIIWLPSITRVPRAPSHIVGVINLRGQIIPIISLSKRLKLKKEAQRSELSRIIVFKAEDLLAGVIVDSVSEVVKVPLANIEAAPEVNTEVESSYIQSVAKMDKQVVIILDIDRIILGSKKENES